MSSRSPILLAALVSVHCHEALLSLPEAPSLLVFARSDGSGARSVPYDGLPTRVETEPDEVLFVVPMDDFYDERGQHPSPEGIRARSLTAAPSQGACGYCPVPRKTAPYRVGSGASCPLPDSAQAFVGFELTASGAEEARASLVLDWPGSCTCAPETATDSTAVSPGPDRTWPVTAAFERDGGLYGFGSHVFGDLSNAEVSPNCVQPDTSRRFVGVVPLPGSFVGLVSYQARQQTRISRFDVVAGTEDSGSPGPALEVENVLPVDDDLALIAGQGSNGNIRNATIDACSGLAGTVECRRMITTGNNNSRFSSLKRFGPGIISVSNNRLVALDRIPRFEEIGEPAQPTVGNGQLQLVSGGTIAAWLMTVEEPYHIAEPIATQGDRAVACMDGDDGAQVLILRYQPGRPPLQSRSAACPNVVCLGAQAPFGKLGVLVRRGFNTTFLALDERDQIDCAGVPIHGSIASLRVKIATSTATETYLTSFGDIVRIRDDLGAPTWLYGEPSGIRVAIGFDGTSFFSVYEDWSIEQIDDLGSPLSHSKLTESPPDSPLVWAMQRDPNTFLLGHRKGLDLEVGVSKRADSDWHYETLGVVSHDKVHVWSTACWLDEDRAALFVSDRGLFEISSMGIRPVEVEWDSPATSEVDVSPAPGYFLQLHCADGIAWAYTPQSILEFDPAWSPLRARRKLTRLDPLAEPNPTLDASLRTGDFGVMRSTCPGRGYVSNRGELAVIRSSEDYLELRSASLRSDSRDDIVDFVALPNGFAIATEAKSNLGRGALWIRDVGPQNLDMSVRWLAASPNALLVQTNDERILSSRACLK